jgi:hypothetical protein
MLPLPFRQEPWVLQSASADQPHPPAHVPLQPEAQAAYALLHSGLTPEEALGHAPTNLVLARAVHQQAPELLQQPVPRWRPRPSRLRPAFLLPGELRCLERSRPLLQALQQRGDLFICTTGAYAAAAADLRPTGLAVVEQEPELLAAEADLAVGSMRQWHKLAVCCQLVRQHEASRGRLYTHLVKLRSDYFYLQPHRLLRELAALKSQPQAGLIGASDKVFAGPRCLMLLLEGFWQALPGHFLDREPHSWPLNIAPILAGDDSAKWYGLGFPQRLVGKPSTVAELRAALIQGGPELARALAQPWRPEEPLVNLFPGLPRFPSEVAFARFLNFNGIALRVTPSLRGFLYSDRSR